MYELFQIKRRKWKNDGGLFFFSLHLLLIIFTKSKFFQRLFSSDNPNSDLSNSLIQLCLADFEKKSLKYK